jgi:hypothetical protein
VSSTRSWVSGDWEGSDEWAGRSAMIVSWWGLFDDRMKSRGLNGGERFYQFRV